MVVGPIEWMDRDTMVGSNVFKISLSVYGTDTGYRSKKLSSTSGLQLAVARCLKQIRTEHVLWLEKKSEPKQTRDSIQQ
jgi:hypothetical protein